MEEGRCLARLPGGLDDMPLTLRERAYLTLPSHLVPNKERRDMDYRALLPEGATTAAGTVHKNKFLRRAAFEALRSRAEWEAGGHRAGGNIAKAVLWERDIAAAEQAYNTEMEGRRSLFFDSLEKRVGTRAARPMHTEAMDRNARDLRAAVDPRAMDRNAVALDMFFEGDGQPHDAGSNKHRRRDPIAMRRVPAAMDDRAAGGGSELPHTDDADEDFQLALALSLSVGHQQAPAASSSSSSMSLSACRNTETGIFIDLTGGDGD